MADEGTKGMAVIFLHREYCVKLCSILTFSSSPQWLLSYWWFDSCLASWHLQSFNTSLSFPTERSILRAARGFFFFTTNNLLAPFFLSFCTQFPALRDLKVSLYEIYSRLTQHEDCYIMVIIFNTNTLFKCRKDNVQKLCKVHSIVQWINLYSSPFI